MVWATLLPLLVFCSYGDALSIYTRYGPKSVKFGYLLAFHVSSNAEMNCFYEDLQKGSTLKVTLSAVDANQHEVHLRISSPSTDYSEWKQGVNSIYQEHVAQEAGTYEICATARVGFGKLRLNLQLLSYLPSDIEAVAIERHKDRTMQEAITDKVNKLVTKIYEMIFHQRQWSNGMKRDELMQEANASWVKLFSLFQIAVILIIGFAQTYTIRRFFNIDSTRIKI